LLNLCVANVAIATDLGSIPASSDTLKSEGAANEAVLKKVIKFLKIPLVQNYHSNKLLRNSEKSLTNSPKCDIFDRSDFYYFYTIKPFWVDDFVFWGEPGLI
jgi:hypothetical protein